MADWDLLLTDIHVATMRREAAAYGQVEDAVIAIRDGTLDFVGPAAELPAGTATESRSLPGCWVTPALVDCHTHLVYAGNRAGEFARRLQGESYADIAAQGGGILATVQATRAASRDELLAQSLPRLRALAADGVATVEIKSGYGLDFDTEIRMLEVARDLGRETGLTVSTTLLAAHALPVEYADRSDAYIDWMCAELLPAVAERGLADAVDGYCESIAFSPAQIDRVFDCATSLGLPVKLHADQLSEGGGAALAARHAAMSADHLEYSTAEGIAALATAGSVAVLLPGAFLTLRETRHPPIRSLRACAVPMALATDCNPGTSPLTSLREAMALASRLFGLTPVECLAGVTREAAQALRLERSRGTVETGKRADLAVWNIDHPDELSYWLGARPLERLFIAGRDVTLREL